MANGRSFALSVSILAHLLLPLSADAQEVRVGSEFQVNTFTNNIQTHPSVAAADDGDFVVAWQSLGQDAPGTYGIFALRFSSAGTPQGSEFQVNAIAAGGQTYPSTAADADGDFVVAWLSFQDGSSFGVFARRVSSTGVVQASEFQVNTYTTGTQANQSVALDADGDFVVVWASTQDGGGGGIFAQRFSSVGTPQATEFQLNVHTTGNQLRPSVAARASGDFVVAWDSNDQDASVYGVFARRFSSAGVPLALEFQVSSYTNMSQRNPSVAVGADGSFVVAWRSAQDGDGDGIFGRRFSSTGAAQAAEFQVNTYTTGAQIRPSVAADAGGDFVVVWDSGQDGAGLGIFARRFSSTVVPQAVEFQVNTYTTAVQYVPSLSADAAGNFVVTWASKNQDGSDYGVFAQRFRDAVVFDVDGNGSVDPLTDGLLSLRYMFGFRGATLITGAVDLANCVRCDAASIEAYLAEFTN